MVAPTSKGILTPVKVATTVIELPDADLISAVGNPVNPVEVSPPNCPPPAYVPAVMPKESPTTRVPIEFWMTEPEPVPIMTVFALAKKQESNRYIVNIFFIVVCTRMCSRNCIHRLLLARQKVSSRMSPQSTDLNLGKL